MKAILTIIFVIVTQTISKVCKYNHSVELTNRTFNGFKYEEGEYFMDKATGTERGCVCMKETCIRKCCPLGKGYHSKSRRCVNVTKEFDPHVWEGSKIKTGFNAVKEFHLLFYKMRCLAADNEFRIKLRRSISTDLHLKTDGKLYVLMVRNETSQEYNYDKYCIDNFVFVNEQTKNVSVYINALICYKPEVEKNHLGESAGCMLISCFFLIMTVAAYAFLPKLRTLHGVVMMTYLLNVFVVFLFMAVMQILLLVNNITMVDCIAMTFVIYFCKLAALFWLNMICYDLWSKLRSSENMASGFAMSTRLRFLLYCLYAFGLPTALTILLATLEFLDLSDDIIILPHLRKQGCFLYGTSKLLYLYTPILGACLANLTFFILISRILARMSKQTQELRKSKDFKRVSLYIKLFIIIGSNWLVDAITAFDYTVYNFWLFIDLYNIVVGISIFTIFVCKKKTLISLRERYRMIIGCRSLNEVKK